MKNSQFSPEPKTIKSRLLLTFSHATFIFLFGVSNAQPTYPGDKMELKAPNSAHVNTIYGPVSGLETESIGIKVFKGVPYARPPMGDLRWRAPEPPQRWQRARSSTKFGTPCWQPHSENAFVWSRGIFERSEDCLYLNVWTDQSIQSPKPVMVWFHGGGHASGWGHGEIFDGTRLAELGVVVVTVNYRLGPWGFLAHPLLANESDQKSSGNYGLLDKIASLKWVKGNIENFGGDPDNVTIFGQSAGSMSVCALMASPLSRGLFHKAIGQSAACLDEFKEDLNGFERGSEMIETTGAKTLKDLRSLTNQQLLDASKTSVKWNSRSKITIDGWVLSEPPIETFAKGRQSEIPLLVGSMANEGHLLFPLNEGLSSLELDHYLIQKYGEKSLKEFKDLYKDDLTKSPGRALREISTDHFMAYSMRLWAELNARKGQPTFLYFMSHVPPAFQIYLAENPELNLALGPRSAGAYHSGDLAFVFNNVGKVGLDWDKADFDLASSISKYWTSFAKTGNPNTPQQENWPAFDAVNYNTQIFDTPISTVQGIRKEKLDLMARATAKH